MADDTVEVNELSDGEPDEHGQEDAMGPAGDEQDNARAIRLPHQPTKDEIARHNITHIPFRSWCPHLYLIHI